MNIPNEKLNYIARLPQSADIGSITCHMARELVAAKALLEEQGKELAARRVAAAKQGYCLVKARNNSAAGWHNFCQDCKRTSSINAMRAICTGWPDEENPAPAVPQPVQLTPGSRGPFCEDGGKCHHSCSSGGCQRRISSGPLSGVFPANEWPTT